MKLFHDHFVYCRHETRDGEMCSWCNSCPEMIDTHIQYRHTEWNNPSFEALSEPSPLSLVVWKQRLLSGKGWKHTGGVCVGGGVMSVVPVCP